MQPRERLELGAEDRRRAREPVALAGEEEDLLEGGDDDVDLVLGDEALDLVDEGLRLVGWPTGRRRTRTAYFEWLPGAWR